MLFVLLLGLVLSGCRLRAGAGSSGGSGATTLPTPIPTTIDLPTVRPTSTPKPVPTITPTPLPDLTVIGLPPESAGMAAYDFSATICDAKWSTKTGSVPCNGTDVTTTSGYVAPLDALSQGLSAGIGGLVMYPPHGGADDTISGRYPDFTVKKGDRFRTVLTCRARNFCDVEFGLEYYDPNGHTGLRRWSYLFADPPIVVDYPLDGIAGLTVQFNLVVQRHGEGLQAYAAWLQPHIHRP
ncbi:MAG TPA: hypothetical protein VMJ64_19190 [Anaerolineales bacterium]|nr:hypothetical protein [Anaerolineales bacterium]